MRRVIAIVAWALALGACSASLPNLSFLKSAPPTEVLRIESDPPGAQAKTTQGPSCRTPCELKLEASSEFSVVVSLDGYQPQTVAVARETPPAMAGSRDAEAAAPARFAPNPVYVELVRAPAAPPATKPSVKKPRQKAAPAAAARSPATPDTATASAGVPAPSEPPMSVPAAEPAVSATNYPWPSR